MTVKFDVGANTGSTTIKLAEDGSEIFAFEPSPLLYPLLKEKFRGNKNIHIFTFAVDIENGFKSFNVSSVGDLGVGSLYDFHHDLQNSVIGKAKEFTTPPAWVETVPCIRLDSFLNLYYPVGDIDYLHIDAQGSDLNVLKSLHSAIERVKAGQLECTLDIPLYEGAQNNHMEARYFLANNGFHVDVVYTHENFSEIDLRFYR